MAMVFQHADEALNPESSVRAVFAGLPSLRGGTLDETVRLLSDLFEPPIDAGLLTKRVKFLSGGQKQRLNLLRGLCLNTDVLILDEPLNGLDFESAGRVIRILQEKLRAGKAILVISHNEEIFDRLVSDNCVYYLRAEGV
jgi:ABC-type multidrug transport system ATPase subunit